jgi:putative SOS response-associated peptidase YedK
MKGNGLRPAWLKGDARGFPNARAETLAEKKSFMKPFATGRVLIPCDGFYEWVRHERCMYAVS